MDRVPKITIAIESVHDFLFLPFNLNVSFSLSNSTHRLGWDQRSIKTISTYHRKELCYSALRAYSRYPLPGTLAMHLRAEQNGFPRSSCGSFFSTDRKLGHYLVLAIPLCGICTKTINSLYFHEYFLTSITTRAMQEPSLVKLVLLSITTPSRWLTWFFYENKGYKTRYLVVEF